MITPTQIHNEIADVVEWYAAYEQPDVERDKCALCGPEHVSTTISYKICSGEGSKVFAATICINPSNHPSLDGVRDYAKEAVMELNLDLARYRIRNDAALAQSAKVWASLPTLENADAHLDYGQHR